MPRPVFNIEEYELRGLVPEALTEAQQENLNKTLSRVQGQIDWTAQLLGFNGPNYWGQSNPKSDFSYNWSGLPQTMNERRQIQVGAFGVYNKNLDYDQWPSPFNREEIKASGDARIHVFERNGITYLSPLGQGEGIDFSKDQVAFVGSSYVFDAEVEVGHITSTDNDGIFQVENFWEKDRLWTRVYILEAVESMTVRIVGSEAKVALVEVLQWKDISDWVSEEVQNQFIGLWGNKGNTLSMDFAFDALDLHGYQEKFSLGSSLEFFISLEELLSLVGLEPTEYTKFNNEKFQFVVGENCDPAIPEYPFDPLEEPIDNGDFDAVDPPTDLLDNGDIDSGIPPTDPPVDSEFYERLFEQENLIPDNLEFANCSQDCEFSLILTQTLTEAKECPDTIDNGEMETPPWIPSDLLNNGSLDDDVVPSPPPVNSGFYDFPGCNFPEYYNGIESIGFKYEHLSDCAKIDYPCVEWVFDPTLDDGEYERTFIPTVGPWATANEGEYDRQPVCNENITQGSERCDNPVLCYFDDGVFDQPGGVDEDGGPVPCDPVLDNLGCEEADGGAYSRFGPPEYEDCNCAIECCEIDNGPYVPGAVYNGPEGIDGGILEEECILYSAGTYDPTVIDYDCTLDDGDFDDPVLASLLADEGTYNRVLLNCEPCENDPEFVPSTPCFVEDFRINLSNAIFEQIVFFMRPNIRNSLTPLRVWKSHVLTVTDTVPEKGTEYFNPLVADENRGPEPEDSYRYFVRLPLEYARNGKEWNRAIAVCNNQGYFSTPTNLSETEADPPVTRPPLYSEIYWRNDLEDYTVFYEEDYLVSEVRQDNQPLQNGFTDSAIVFEVEQPIPYSFAQISEYDPFFLRKPLENGEWKGSYFTYGLSALGERKRRTGFLHTDIESQAIIRRQDEISPVYDYSTIKAPNVEFPDSVDQAALKNYVVSYAYFTADFSASDDPVFDPQTLHCWRSPSLNCFEEKDGDCIDYCKPTNTAYRLHEYETSTC